MAKGIFSRFRDGLKKTTQAIGLGGLFTSSSLDEDFFEELEEKLLIADVGPSFCLDLVEDMREQVDSKSIKDLEQARNWLRAKLLSQFELPETSPENISQSKPATWFFLGVNGVGKTTSLGKLAKRLRQSQFEVLLAAGDTFRAAAGEQLDLWAQRTDCQIVRHKEGGDPSAVLFDAYDAAKSRDIDYLLVDTAGRLHNKKNLMAECEKMFRVLKHKQAPEPEEVLLVVDATTGQNALQQAKLFNEVTRLTGIILTKLDGSAKGGIGLQLVKEIGVPIKYVALGEGEDDLIDFDPEHYVDAILELDIA